MQSFPFLLAPFQSWPEDVQDVKYWLALIMVSCPELLLDAVLDHDVSKKLATHEAQ